LLFLLLMILGWTANVKVVVKIGECGADRDAAGAVSGTRRAAAMIEFAFDCQ
jgi:hypothetical protein